MFDNLEKDEMIKEWEKFKITVKENPAIRPATQEAWERCKNLGLEPDELKFTFLSEGELQQKLKDNADLIEVAKPYLEHLSMSLEGIPYLVALSDKDGWIINIKGALEEFGGRAVGMCLGASWAEEAIGNNGIGTALTLEKPVLVYGEEHYGTIYGSAVCIGVPIRNNGEIIGAIDVSVPSKYGHPARLHLVVACANSIETTISKCTSTPFGISSDMKLSATSELIATAVHDLKNPLAIIRGLGELGKLTADNEETSSYFNRVIKQTDELNGLVTELLSIFKPQKLTCKRVNTAIAEVLQAFKPQCNSKGIVLNFTTSCDKCINMSEGLFKRAISNLITNATQMMTSGGLIDVKVESEEDFIIISISDTAGGIPESIRDNLFEPFTFRRSGGTGIGLFMVYHAITNTHRGKIWFATKTGEGTTFFIKLPVVKESRHLLTNELIKEHQLA